MKKIFLLLAVLSTLSNISFAANTTGTFTSSAKLGGSCTIEANNLDFGDLTAIGSIATVSKPLTLNVLCSKDMTFNVLLDAGINHDAENNRLLKAQNSNDVIQYGICQSAAFSTAPFACSTPWWGTSYYYTSTGTGKTQVVSGYIFARTGFYKPDNYSDTVVTTINF